MFMKICLPLIVAIFYVAGASAFQHSDIPRIYFVLNTFCFLPVFSVFYSKKILKGSRSRFLFGIYNAFVLIFMLPIAAKFCVIDTFEKNNIIFLIIVSVFILLCSLLFLNKSRDELAEHIKYHVLFFGTLILISLYKHFCGDIAIVGLKDFFVPLAYVYSLLYIIFVLIFSKEKWGAFLIFALFLFVFLGSYIVLAR